MTQEAKEIIFDKYNKKGAYHWRQCSNSLLDTNAHVKARYKIVLKCLKKYAGHIPAQVLDVGCGDGALAGWICRSGYGICGIDVDREGLALAKEKFAENNLNGKFFYVDNYAYPFNEDSFDAVVCADVIEHVQQPKKLLEEAHRVLKRGGHLVITTPIKVEGATLGSNHVQEWSVNEFTELCSKVFGAPVQRIISHPLFLYQLYTSKKRPIRAASRLAVNIFSILHINMFLKTACGNTNKYQMQTLVLRKAG